MTDKNKDLCPQCGNWYKGIGVHWARSSSCSYPELTERQNDIINGLLLSGAGGFSGNLSDGELHFIVHSTNRELLDWLDDEFGIISKGVSLAISSEDSEENLANLRKVSGDNTAEDYNTSDIYRWGTRRLPLFANIRNQWMGENSNELEIPFRFEPNALILSIIYTFRGYVNTNKGESNIILLVKKMIGSSTELVQLLSEFDPSIWESNISRIVLRNSAPFARTILNVEFSPVEYAENQLSNIDSLMEQTNDSIPCPDCGSRFSALGRHWKHSSCEPPSLTKEQRNFLTGLLIVGGGVKEIKSKNQETSTIVINHFDREFLQWLHDWFSLLSRGIITIDSRTVLNPFGESEDKNVEFSESYQWDTRSCSVFNEFSEWYDNGQKRIPEDNIKREKEILRAMYALKGRQNSSNVRIYITKSTASNEFFEQLFKPFNGTVKEKNSSRFIEMSNAELFFDYIRPVPPRTHNP